MFIQFKEKFALPVSEIYPYFRTPEDWGRLYGRVKPVEHLREGWQAVALPRFPLPLVNRMVDDQQNRRVRWVFSRAPARGLPGAVDLQNPTPSKNYAFGPIAWRCAATSRP